MKHESPCLFALIKQNGRLKLNWFQFKKMNINEDNTHAFIVRFWLEPRELENARPIWRGVIEHVASGRRFFLKSLDEITAFIESYLPGINEIH